MSNSQLPLFLWREALQKDCYVHTKLPFLRRQFLKHPLRYRQEGKPVYSISILGVVRQRPGWVYNPQEKKLDPRTLSGYFIGYSDRGQG